MRFRINRLDKSNWLPALLRRLSIIKTWIFTTKEKNFPAFFQCVSPAPLSFLQMMCAVQSTHCTRTWDLICWACYKVDLEGRFDWGVQNPGEGRGLIESSEWDYFTFHATLTRLTAGRCCKWSDGKNFWQWRRGKLVRKKRKRSKGSFDSR